MKTITHGWVVINSKHPTTGKEVVSDFSFARTRKGAINQFVEGSSASWKYWRAKWNFRVIKAKCTIETLNQK